MDIQAENRALQTEDRSRIIRNALIFLGIHTFVFIMLQLLMGQAQKHAEECEKSVAEYMLFFKWYFGLCAARQLVVCLVLKFTKQPQKTSDQAYLVFIILDAVFVSSLTVWGTMVQTDAAVSECRELGNNWVLLMYIFSICCLLYGWIYVILLCCGLTSLPLISIFWCFYRKQMKNMQGEMGIN